MKNKEGDDLDDGHISLKDKKKFLINEVQLKNELNYQIHVSQNNEGKERFIAFLHQIEAMKKMDVKVYMKLLEENYDYYKGEIDEMVKAREMEERINKFMNAFKEEREMIQAKRKFFSNKAKAKDSRIQISMGDNIKRFFMELDVDNLDTELYDSKAEN